MQGDKASLVSEKADSEGALVTAWSQRSSGKRTALHVVAEVFRYSHLLENLILQDLRIRYRRSFLGFFWALLNPLFMMIVYTVVFSSILLIEIDNYPVFLLSALLPWTFFSQALSYCSVSLVSNGALIRKIYVPKAAFPISAALANVVNFCLSFIPFLLLIVALGMKLSPSLLFLPVSITILLAFTTGMGLILSAAAAYFRDVNHILEIVLRAWFYITPILYNVELVPDPYRWAVQLNPMMHLTSLFREPIYYQRIPSLEGCLIGLALGAASLVAGVIVFRRLEDSLVYYV